MQHSNSAPVEALRRFIVLTLATTLVGCGATDDSAENPPDASATADAAMPGKAMGSDGDTPFAMTHTGDLIDASRLAMHTRVLSSDEYEGRGPNSPGEERTKAYLAQQFGEAGLSPANGDSFFQEVPVVEITTDPNIYMNITRGGERPMPLAYGDDMMVWTKRVAPSAAIEDSELVFVGYGIVAPEYNWNDYEGVDMTGKTAVIFVNDPGFATGDEALFRGKAMTYYGRWTYKYEEAARQGAAGAIIVHETAPAAYPWAVVSGSWSGPQFDLVAEDNNMSRVAVEGWVTVDVAKVLFENAGMTLDEAHRFALERDIYAPRPMGQTASVELTNIVKRSFTSNVAAILPGTSRADETVIYMAHWDHMGRDPRLEGDQIFNGAVDNASGTSALIELAHTLAGRDAPERSILFLATAAEESGLLGSKYYASSPLRPLATTVAAINMDGMNVHGKTHDISVVGYGSSELENYLEAAAATQQRVVKPEPTPEKGYFYRSDHFNLAKVGVPVLYFKSGIDYVDGGVERGRELAADYTSVRYHKPADEFDPDWDWSGASQDVTLYYMIGNKIANQGYVPNWFEGTEFRGIRDESRAAL